MPRPYQPKENATQAATNIFSTFLFNSKNVTELQTAIANRKSDLEQSFAAFSQVDRELFTDIVRLELAWHLSKNIGYDVRKALRTAYSLPIGEVESLNKCADNGLALLHNEFTFSLNEIAKIAQLLSLEDLQQIAHTRYFYMSKKLVDLKKKTANFPDLEFVKQKNITNLNPPFKMFSQALIALLDRKYTVNTAKDFIYDVVKNARACGANINNFEHAYLLNNIDCFVKKIDFTYHLNYIYEASRLEAVNSLITVLNFDPKDAVDMIYNELCFESCKYLQTIPFAQLNIVNEALIGLLEANPTIDIFQAKQIVVQIAMNVSLASNFSLANAPALFEQHNINYQHVGLLERKKLKVITILIKEFDFMIREAFQQAATFSVTEIKELIEATPVDQILFLKSLILDMLKSSPLRSCQTIEEAMFDALNLPAVKQEIALRTTWKNTHYIGPHRNVVINGKIQSWHVEKLLAKKTEDFLTAQAAIFADQRQLSYGNNAAIVTLAHENMAVWHNLTVALKFNCIEARNNLLSYSPQQIRDLPAIVAEDMPTFNRMLGSAMVYDDILSVDEYAPFDRVVNREFAEFARTRERLGNWYVGQLFSKQAAVSLLTDIQNEKETSDAGYQEFLINQDNYYSFHGENSYSPRITHQPNSLSLVEASGNFSANSLLFNPVVNMRIQSSNAANESYETVMAAIGIFSVVTLIGVACKLKPWRLITSLFQGFSFFQEKTAANKSNFKANRTPTVSDLSDGSDDEETAFLKLQLP